jgi:hypothetical protein
MKHTTAKILVLILSTLVPIKLAQAVPPSADDVGDAGSFGHNAQYIGAASGFITLSTDPCPSPTPTPSPPATANDNQCFQIVAAPATTTFDAEDSCRIKLPKDATRTIIYPVLNFFYIYTMDNTTVSDGQARFQFTANLTIESDALLDPSIIDPATGLPANGKLVRQFTPNRVFDDRHLDPGEHAEVRLTFTRAGNAGINKAQLVGSGLSQMVVDKLFKSAMTIRLNVVGTTKLVTDASITTNMRLFGD